MPGLGERVAEAARVVVGRVAGEEEGERRCAELELAAGLEREEAAAGQGSRRPGGVLDHVEGDGTTRVGGVDDEPLELDADEAVGTIGAIGMVEAARRDDAAGLDPAEDGSVAGHGLPMPEVCGHPIHVTDRAELEMVDQRMTHGNAASWLARDRDDARRGR